MTGGSHHRRNIELGPKYVQVLGREDVGGREYGTSKGRGAWQFQRESM